MVKIYFCNEPLPPGYKVQNKKHQYVKYSTYQKLQRKIDLIEKILPRGEATTCPECKETSINNYLGCGEFRCVQCEAGFSWDVTIDWIYSILYPKDK